MKDWRELVSEEKGNPFNNSLLEDKSYNNYTNLNTTNNDELKNLNNSKLDSLKQSIVSNLISIRKNRSKNVAINDSEIINENCFSNISASSNIFRKSEKQKLEEYFKSKKIIFFLFYINLSYYKI